MDGECISWDTREEGGEGRGRGTGPSPKSPFSGFWKDIFVGAWSAEVEVDLRVSG